MNYHKGDFYKERTEPPERKGWIVGRFLEDIKKTEFVAVKSWEFKKGQTTNHPRKYEREATEINFILKGEVRGLLDGEEITLKAGEYVVIPPKVESNLVREIIKDAEGLTIKFPSLSVDDSVKLPD